MSRWSRLIAKLMPYHRAGGPVQGGQQQWKKFCPACQKEFLGSFEPDDESPRKLCRLSRTCMWLVPLLHVMELEGMRIWRDKEERIFSLTWWQGDNQHKQSPRE